MNQSTLPDGFFEIGTATDAGRARQNNEDAYAVFQAWLQVEHEPEGLRPVQVAVVADGVGGSVAGERASNLAVEIIEKVMTEDSVMPISQRLEKAITRANSILFDLSTYMTKLRGMATTVVAAAIVDEHLHVAHAGDSRAYLIRDGRAYLLTKDHTWAQEAIDAGYLTPEQAAKHPNRHVIMRFLGVTSEVEVDHRVMDLAAENTPDSTSSGPRMIDRLRLRPGDMLLLCTDGLTDAVNDQKIQSAVSSRQPQKAADKLIHIANGAGGPDNITTVLVHWPDGRQRSRRGPLPLVLLAAASAILLILLLEIFNPSLIDGTVLDSLGGFLPDAVQVHITPAAAERPEGAASASSTQPVVAATALQTPSPTPVRASAAPAGASGNATATSTATARPTAVAQATIQASLPTSTLYVTPIMTLVPTSTVAPPTIAETNSPVPMPTAYSTIELLRPHQDETIEKKDLPVVFQWRFGDNCLPLEEEGFEVRVWAKGQPPGGIMDAQTQQHQIDCDRGVYSFQIQNFESVLHGSTGVLYWNVYLVKIKPNYVSPPLAETAPVKFNFVSD
jgi:serine/threonine protein phosphatase PrpC